MSRTFTTNLTHLLDEKGAIPDSLSKPAKKLVDNFSNIISNVTTEPRLNTQANLACWGKIGKKKCHGNIHASIDLDTFNIYWHCSECGDNGTISHWENSFWDCGYR